MLIVFSGLSASGKNTIMNYLLKIRKDIKILEQSSGTTRPPRESDKEYNTYCYMSDEEFKKGIKENKFFEYEEVHGYYYGILNEALQRVIDDKENDYMRDIDVHGCQRLKNYLKGKAQVVSIFLDAPDEVLRERLRNRGESEDRIEVRLSRGQMERKFKKDYDLVINNLDLSETAKIISKYLDNKKQSLR